MWPEAHGKNFYCKILFDSGKQIQDTDDFLKFNSLNKVKQSFSVKNIKSALLTILNQNSFNYVKSNIVLHIFTTNYIIFQKWTKVEVSKVFRYI